MINITEFILSVIIITSLILSIIIFYYQIVTSFEKLEKAEKERHDIIIKLIENMGNIYSQK